MSINQLPKMWRLTFKEVMTNAKKRHGARLTKSDIQNRRTTYQSLDPWAKSVALCYLIGIDDMATPETAVNMFRGIFHQDPISENLWRLQTWGEMDMAAKDVVEFLKHITDYGNPEDFFGRAVRIAGHGLFHSPAGILVFELPLELKSNSDNASGSSCGGGSA